MFSKWKISEHTRDTPAFPGTNVPFERRERCHGLVSPAPSSLRVKLSALCSQTVAASGRHPASG